MFRRSDRWWVRELERIQRAHAQQVQTLVEQIAHLAGKPLPATAETIVVTRPPDPAPNDYEDV